MLLINVFNYDTNQPIRDQNSDLPSVYIFFSMNWIIPAPLKALCYRAQWCKLPLESFYATTTESTS